jgi:putative PIN family toxin of toxin-antitoxin system
VKVVFDTNIYISALVIPNSKAEEAIIKIIEGSDTLLLSKEIMGEILSVLSIKFHRDREAISHVAFYLSDLARMIKPTRKIRLFKDDPDNRILECAVSGRADVIVTGDKEILKLGEYEGIKIISLKDYLEM